MKLRTLAALFVGLGVAACGGPSDDAADSAPAMSQDEQALNDLAQYYATHFNMGHASMVASVYADGATTLNANGMVSVGAEAITASLEAGMAGSPEITLQGGDMMVMDDAAVGWGTYTIAATPEGADPLAYAGAYMTASSKAAGEWKIGLSITNYDSARPDGWPWAESDDSQEPPEDAGTMDDLIGAYMTHWNLGHPSMVADYYTEDATVGFANNPVVHGREAVSAVLAERMAAVPSKLTIHDVATTDYGNGWALDAGWYQMDPPDGGDPLQIGGYVALVKQAEDGSWQLHWTVTNGWQPQGM
jgi:uncharacterized protein (TIGR02246 family)